MRTPSLKGEVVESQVRLDNVKKCDRVKTIKKRALEAKWSNIKQFDELI